MDTGLRKFLIARLSGGLPMTCHCGDGQLLGAVRINGHSECDIKLSTSFVTLNT